MLDKNVKEVLDLSDIKGVMVEVMLNKYTEREVSKTTLNKFGKYMAITLKTALIIELKVYIRLFKMNMKVLLN